MNLFRCAHLTVAVLLLVMLTGCITQYDYTNYRAHQPRSILVLPPLNESADGRATYGFLSKVTKPIAEEGYYVFPVMVVDQMMKANGLPTAGEIQQLPLIKISEVIGADAVLYSTVKEYGSKYYGFTSITWVAVKSKLVDVKTGSLIWEGRYSCTDINNFISLEMLGDPMLGVFIAPFVQASNVSRDSAHQVSELASYGIFCSGGKGLLLGPYVPWGKPR